MKKGMFLSITGLSLLLVAGCGTHSVTGTQSPSPVSNATGATSGSASTNTAGNSTNAGTIASDSNGFKHQHIYLSVLPGGKLGPDGKKHDAFSPSDFSLTQGVPVTITIYNFDDMQHSLTSSNLGLNIQASPAKGTGDPGVTTVTFTPSKAGDFQWQCIDPCDLENNQWAMSHAGYMMGTITISNSATSAGETQGSTSVGANSSNGGGNSGMMGNSSGMMNGQSGEGMQSMMG